MSPQAIPQGASTNFQTAPAGTFLARCYQVIQLGTQTIPGGAGWDEKQQFKIRLGWELPTEMMETTEEFPDQRPFTIYETYTFTLDDRGNFRKLLAPWVPAWDLEDMDANGSIELEDLLGLPGMLSVVHNRSKKDPNRVFANVASCSQLMDGMVCPEPINKPVFFWMNYDGVSPDGSYTSDFDSLSSWLQKTIKASPEYAAWVSYKEGRQSDAALDSALDAGGLGGTVNEASKGHTEAEGPPIDDDEPPF